MRSAIAVRLLAASCALALVLTGCGDDDDSATTTTTSAVDAGDGGSEPDAPSTTAGDTTPTSEPTAQDPPDPGDQGEGQGDPLVFVGTLSGDQEVPGPGDPGGAGRVEIESDIEGRLCFDMVATGLDADVVAAHIHEAAAGASGGVVIDIGAPTAVDGATDTWTDVCLAVAGDVVQRLNADPAQFYANVHTSTFPDGAVRAQLEQATIFDLELG